MPRPISATISVSALTHNLATVRRHLIRRPRRPRACRRPSGPSSRPMPTATASNRRWRGSPRRRGWRCWTWTRRWLPRGRLGRSDPAAGGFLRTRRPGHRRPLSPEHQRASPRAARHAGAGAPVAQGGHHAQAEQRHEPAGFQPGGLSGGLRARPASAAAGRAGLGRQDDPFRLRRWSAGRQRATGPVQFGDAQIPGAVSVCNSAATLRFAEIAVGSETQAHWVRPGVCLYGASPFADADAASFGLRPAQSLRSEIIAVQELKAGDSVGYGAIFRAERAMRIGVVACGYADGYPGTPPPARPSWWQACAPSWLGGCPWTC